MAPMKLLVPAAVALAMVSGGSLAHAEVLVGLAVPLTGPSAWIGEEGKQGVDVAVADVNARGGVLGEPIEVIEADDYCDGEQAVAAAKKLVAAGVVAVFGHGCSGAAVPASKVYADARILMISLGATNPKLTEQGFTNVFRMAGRDDLQGRIAGDLLADRWGNRRIAILHDGQIYGQGLAEETRKRLNQRGITEAMFEAIDPGRPDYWDIVQKMRAMGVQVLYYGGYAHEAALIIRQAKEHGYDLQLVAGGGISREDFGLIAGQASDGTLMTLPPSPSGPEAVELAAKFAEGLPPAIYCLRRSPGLGPGGRPSRDVPVGTGRERRPAHEFDTVLGRIGFDAKGDLTGHEKTLSGIVWKGGKYAPVETAQGHQVRSVRACGCRHGFPSWRFLNELKAMLNGQSVGAAPVAAARSSPTCS